jgi:thioredoxin-like negative regulator of GroEL
VIVAGAAFVLALAGTPGDRDAALAEARGLLAANRHEEALKAFKAASDRFDDCGPCVLGMAEARYLLGEADEAVKQADRALRRGLAPGEATAKAHLIRGLGLARGAAGQAGPLKKAEAALRQAAQEAPGDGAIRFNLGVVLMRQARDDEGAAVLRAYLEEFPKGAMAETARRYIADPRRTRARFAPSFTVETLQGERLSLADLKEKTVVLDFWATWCGPCVAAIPELKDLLRKHSGTPLVLVSISVDQDEDTWRKFVSRQSMSWPQYRDQDRRLQEMFGVRAFPTYIVIDGDGIIRHEIMGTDTTKSVGYRLKGVLETIQSR